MVRKQDTTVEEGTKGTTLSTTTTPKTSSELKTSSGLTPTSSKIRTDQSRHRIFPQLKALGDQSDEEHLKEVRKRETAKLADLDKRIRALQDKKDSLTNSWNKVYQQGVEIMDDIQKITTELIDAETSAHNLCRSEMAHLHKRINGGIEDEMKVTVKVPGNPEGDHEITKTGGSTRTMNLEEL